MAISVDCPGCGKTLKAKDSAAGKTAKCPACQGLIEIPAIEEIYDAEDATGDEYDREEDPVDEYSSPAIDDPNAPLRPCPMCGEMIQKKAKKCRHCGEYFDKEKNRSSKRRSGSGSRLSGASLPVADLGKRFIAALADSFFAFMLIVPGVGLIIAANPDSPQSNEGLIIGGVLALLVGGLVVLVMNLYLLATRSQSFGKWLLKIQIIDIETDEPAGFVKAWVLRSFVNGLIGAIPYIGSCYSLVDILMIFGEERRCLHDQIAGTYVADIS